MSCYWFDAPGGQPPNIQVAYTETGDAVDIVRTGDEIRVNGNACTDGSTVGTVTNTEYVSVTTPDTPIGDTTTNLSLAGGEFEPGFEEPGYEGTGVVFTAQADPPSSSSSGDVLGITGGTGRDDVRLGLNEDPQHQVNLDADDDAGVDITDSAFNGTTLRPTTDEFRFAGAAGGTPPAGAEAPAPAPGRRSRSS